MTLHERATRPAPRPADPAGDIRNDLRLDAAALLGEGRVNMIIGYEAQGDRRRPRLVADARDVEALTYDSLCRQNLAAYLKKDEVRRRFPVALVAPPATLRSLLLLAGESQLPPESVLVLAVDETRYHGALELDAAAAWLNEKHPEPAFDPELLRQVERVRAMSPQQRAAFWTEQFARCTRCYACRAACPSCYCKRCIVEKNAPQWVSTAARGHGNYAWQIIRAFHTAGRCTACGACQAACPQGIPLMLLNVKVGADVAAMYGVKVGYDPQAKPVVGSWSPEDKEDFIR